MKERPILFSGPMVRAILEGRKTQTRRLFKDKVSADCVEIHWNEAAQQWRQMFYANKKDNLYPKQWWHKCPYGQPGDRLWVKETYRIADGGTNFYEYAAGRSALLKGIDEATGVKWKPSIFCPRKASRITLEITTIRVERLQDITDDDCAAEGCCNNTPLQDSEPAGRFIGTLHDWSAVRLRYRALWESINGPESWDANPWVWVVEFRKI